jgi:hypothetical protein
VPGGPGEFDDLGREVPEYELTRYHDDDGWHDGAPDLDTLRDHVGDPDFMVTVHFPEFDANPDIDDHYNMVGGFEDWDDFEVGIVDMYTDYVAAGE